jgi:hypothetical protein
MKKEIEKFILEATSSKELEVKEKIQDLWSGYGEILRISLKESTINQHSVVVKYVTLPEENSKNHPKGWNSSISHQRKIKSYQVEITWYKEFSTKCNQFCKVPKLLGHYQQQGEYIMVLEDLDTLGFNQRHSYPNVKQMKTCLRWLAHFHALFMNVDFSSSGLWKIGTYWHLETRPEEFEVLKDENLKKLSTMVDEKLNATCFPTLLHGDAKVENFCFSSKDVSAVDFQYVGGGCGMKDVIYFFSSCFDSKEFKNYESLQKELLVEYFSQLKESLKHYHPEIDFDEVEKEYRFMMDYAWIDFYRFLKGWSPGFWKMETIEKIVKKIIREKFSREKV